MKFLIVSHWEAKQLVEEHPGKLNVISAEKTETVDAALCKHHLHLKMDDILDKHIEKFDKELKNLGQIYPEKKHIIKAIEFANKYKVHVIHCHAGISRSPAIGYAILRSKGIGEKEAMTEIFRIVPNAMPNQRIVRLTDELFPE